MTTPQIQQQFALAVQHHQSGRLADAERFYRAVLAAEPRHADALHMLGILAHQVGQNAVAIQLLQQALAIQPGSVQFQCNLGLVLNAAGRHAEAAALLERAVASNPSMPEAQNNLGIALWNTGQSERAIVAWKEAIRLQARMAEAHNSLGTAHQQTGQLEAALAEFREALRINPSLVESHNNLGIVLKQLGRAQESIGAFQSAIRLMPGRADFHDNLGTALWSIGQAAQAADAYRTAIRLQPQVAAYHSHLSNALWACGLLDDALAEAQEALRLDPRSAESHAALGNLLKDQGHLEEAIAAFERAVALNPSDPALHSSLIYLLHFKPEYDPTSLRRELDAWVSRHAAALEAVPGVHTQSRDPHRRVRVGYVSPDFREHSVSRFMLPILQHHNHEQFEIVCYSDAVVEDAVTQQLRSSTDRWMRITGISDADLAQRIQSDQIDILVDLASHTPGNRLLTFARRPAPVQMTYLSYPSTTGLRAIQYRISDPYLDPPGSHDPAYSEQTLRLPETYWCYEPGGAPIEIAPLPALSTGHITFGCLNTVRKVSPQSLQTWARILRQVDTSRLLLFVGEGAHRRRITDLFARDGIDPSRIEFVGYSPFSTYLSTYQRIDIALDPFPYTGGTTTCDALWMGVPVVTIAGKAAVHRGGVSILTNLGMPQLVAGSIDENVKIAVDLARDVPNLAKLRQNLRPMMQSSPLMDAPRFVRNLETLYRNAWETWCRNAP